MMGVRLTVGQQTLNLYVEVRILHPQLKLFPFEGRVFSNQAVIRFTTKKMAHL